MKKSQALFSGILFSLLVTFSTSTASYGTLSDEVCNSCASVRYAAELAVIEKYLQQSDPAFIETLDEEAYQWFEKFQDGGILFDGWKEISADVVAAVPDEIKIYTKIVMLALGVRIGCEWSKDNDIRKISTKMLKKWGKELQETVDEQPGKIPIMLKNIEQQVDILLSGVNMEG